MTDERSTRHDEVTDAEVSRTYREVATERAPASLNERVLRAANARTGHGYSWTISWLRPMAWAATIGLCLAIVVELDNVSQLGEPLPERQAIEPASSPEEAVAETKESPAGIATPVTQGRMDQSAEDKRERSVPAAATLERLARDEAPGTSAPEPPRENVREYVDTRGFEVSDAPLLEEADELAKMRQGPDQEADSVAPALASRFAQQDLAVPSRCDDDARGTPESWFECIEQLEDAGFDAAAEQELAELKDAFPEFEIP